MNIVYVGITHDNTPLYLRERTSFAKDNLNEALLALQREKSILENVIVSTCNRTEIYALCDQIHTGQYYIKHFLAKWFDLTFEEIKPYIEIKIAEDVIEHLLLLSTGMKSQIMGETQILGQIKEAYQVALNSGTTGIFLNRLFQQAQRFGKRQQTVHQLNQKPRSISFQTMKMIQKDPLLAKKKLLLIGLGEIGQLLLKYALASDLQTIYLLNRTFDKTVKYSRQDPNRIIAVPMSRLEALLPECDYIVTAVGTTTPIITEEMVKAEKPQAFFDLGLPRNIKGIKTDSNHTYYNVDTINQCIEENRAELSALYDDIRDEAYKEIIEYYKWKATLNVTPVIDALRHKMGTHYDQVQASLFSKVHHLSPHDQKVINKHLKSLVNAMLKEPIMTIKELDVDAYGSHKLDFVKTMFQLEKESDQLMDTNNQTNIITVGTRGSKLATIQTQMVIDQLQSIFPSYHFVTKIITTKGDKDQTSSLSKIGGKGVFMKELERELLNGKIDMAVHSLKDVPSQLAEGTMIACTPKRASVQECLLMKEYKSFQDLPSGARIGTGSLRRVRQLRQMRPDLEYVDIRGNIDTRINKLTTENLDGVVLAVAGLERAGFYKDNLNLHTEIFNEHQIIPAVGQGSLAIQCRSNETALIQLLRAINHESTETCIQLERQFLACLGLGCNFPIACYARIENDGQITITGMLASRQSELMVVEQLKSDPQKAQNLGRDLYQRMMAKGGLDIMKEYAQESGEIHEG
ncbi:glutamyl-tRNA reductase [Facklamia sp. DSM 111018]|uniref:Multifunctional fusion protein n=1 Tax=Facklamia lactis TaxID=2749967 RepID=A0ABS0LNU3_9LACT|nr:hydroxymethylbilane synthase [Facklamia lactis]MBG9979509.1 glutamyl-tRNA reductase [Facklamia lactis]MBG9985821.1 glutamyl-tRNA reductase [Facklamia lactis]